MRSDIPLVATNEPFFAKRDDYEAHDALICIAEGRVVAETDRRQLTPEHYFKSRAEMAALFADLPEALASTVEIAQRCAFRPRTRKPILPRFSVGDGAPVDEARRTARRAPKRASSAASPRTGSRPGRTDRGLPRAARLRARRHRGDEISRLLPDRRRLHPVGEGAGHSGRAGPRLGRRLAGRLCADHHRPRSAPLRPAVRALPQSRARVDAGLRHRLLPGPARRGDPLRAGALRPRPGGADHHLRHAAGARRAARRRPRAGDALRPGRQALQAGAAEPGRSGDARQGDRGRAAAAGRARRRAGRQARLRHRAEARRPLPPRLDPRRRHRDRRPAADRAGAALPRSEIRHAGHPVQHEMGRAGGAGEVRLPRPEDADRAADARCELLQQRGIELDLAAIPLDDKKTYEHAGARRDGRRLPGGKPGHAARAARHAAGPLRGHHRAGRALPAGPDGQHPDLLRAQARHGAARIHPSQARADPAARPTASSSIRNR